MTRSVTTGLPKGTPGPGLPRTQVGSRPPAPPVPKAKGSRGLLRELGTDRDGEDPHAMTQPPLQPVSPAQTLSPPSREAPPATGVRAGLVPWPGSHAPRCSVLAGRGGGWHACREGCAGRRGHPLRPPSPRHCWKDPESQVLGRGRPGSAAVGGWWFAQLRVRGQKSHVGGGRREGGRLSLSLRLVRGLGNLLESAPTWLLT